MELGVSITIYYEIPTWDLTFITVKSKSTNSMCTPAGVDGAVTNMQ